MSSTPRVSVVISAWRAAGTIRACLDSIGRQRFRDFEVLLVDGGPDHVAERTAIDYDFVRYFRIDEFCTMHRKRNLGVAESHGELLVFSDPDVVADEGWLEQLVACWRRHRRPVAGAIACLGDRLVDRIVHLIKFDYWLPRGDERPVDAAATASMLVSRRQFDELGGFVENTYLGDLQLSRDLAAHGHPLIFCPAAVIEHDHENVPLLASIREHWRRGREFQQMDSDPVSVARLLRHSLLWLPRLIRRTARTVSSGLEAGDVVAALVGTPVIAAAHAAWLCGESRALWGRLVGGTEFTRTPTNT